MKHKKIKRRLVIFLLVNAVLLCIYGYLFYVVDSKNAETAALYAASHQAASDKGKIQGLERALKETENDRRKLSEYFVTKTNAVTFIEQIEKTGKEAGVKLSVDSVSDEVKESGAIQLSFSATGEFSDLYRLVALIESMPYKIVFKKADVQKSGGVGEGVGAWKGNFTVTLESFVASGATASARGSEGTAQK